jgi:hypothetical protein
LELETCLFVVVHGKEKKENDGKKKLSTTADFGKSSE